MIANERQFINNAPYIYMIYFPSIAISLTVLAPEGALFCARLRVTPLTSWTVRERAKALGKLQVRHSMPSLAPRLH